MDRVTLVANDFGESGTLKLLKNELDTSETEVEAFLGNGQTPFPYPAKVVNETIAKSEIAVVTMSETSEAEVAAAQSAVKHGVSLALVALGSSFNAYRNEAFAPVREHAELLFVVNEEEARAAHELFPNTKIVPSGNPEWESFFMPALSREEVRKRLDLTDDMIFVLVVGDKKINLNRSLAMQTINAVRSHSYALPFSVIFSVHPGHEPLSGMDQTPTEHELVSFYQRLIEEYSPNARIGVSCKAHPYGIGTPQMIAGADIVIGGTSTELIRAACQRIRSIAVLTYEALGSTNELAWRPCDWGAIRPVYGQSSVHMAHNIAAILSEQGFEDARKRQMKAFPEQAPGTAIAKMVAAIKETAGI